MITQDVIAQVCHGANRSYCRALGDMSQPEWEGAPQWQKDSAKAGVKAKLANPHMSPEDMHRSWYAQKLADGWRYGPVKNPETKEHPCMVEYDKLPSEQQAKDHIFSAIIGALKHLLPVPKEKLQ